MFWLPILGLSLSLLSCFDVELRVRDDGTYSILKNSETWFESSSFGFVEGKEWYSSDGRLLPSAGILKLDRATQGEGHDEHGDFTFKNFSWSTSAGGSFLTTFVTYTDLPFFVFRQGFPIGARETAIGDSPDVLSSFPSLKVEERSKNLNFLTFGECFCRPESGHWHQKSWSPYVGGHTKGPVAIYDKNLDTLLVSPLRNFMVASQVRDTKSLQNDFMCGIEANIEGLPEAFFHETVMYYGQGIAKSFVEWGDFMLAHYKKRRTESRDDSFLSQLSYLTDNGAYYFYHTQEGKNYAETMIDVAQYLKTQSIPIGNIEFDSWWYPKDPTEPRGGGLLIWEPMTSVFPDGMKSVINKIDLSVGLHSRWFSHQNYYLTRLNFTFFVEGGCALPKGKDVWRDMMSKAKSWGMTMYLQDWLIHTFDACSVVQTELGVGREWMMDFGLVAEELGVTVQYCMPLPLHMLQSLEVGNVVTHARASNDYLPVPDLNQWNIGLTSMFYWSIGVVPHKDDFWTTTKWEENCTFVYCMEPNPEIQVVVAALSFGPVGFSDAIGSEDRALIMETCRQDGLLLKPDRPLLPLDEVFVASFEMIWVEPMNIWSSLNCFDTEDEYGRFCYVYVLTVDLGEPYKLTTEMLPYDAEFKTDEQFVAFRWEKGQTILSNLTIFDSEHSLPLQATPFDPFGNVNFDLWSVVALRKGACDYVYLKEMRKIVGASNERIAGFSCVDGSYLVDVLGVPEEQVTFAIYEKSTGRVIYTACVIGETGKTRVTCKNGKCASKQRTKS